MCRILSFFTHLLGFTVNLNTIDAAVVRSIFSENDSCKIRAILRKLWLHLHSPAGGYGWLEVKGVELTVLSILTVLDNKQNHTRFKREPDSFD